MPAVVVHWPCNHCQCLKNAPIGSQGQTPASSATTPARIFQKRLTTTAATPAAVIMTAVVTTMISFIKMQN